MTTHSHTHVEDYIEIIAGYRLPNGTLNRSIFLTPDALISLARYDVKVIESLAEQGINNTAYTDKQAKLATDLVIKYERQLARHQIDITNIKNNPEFRMPLRVIDRTSKVWVEEEKICIKFPYVPEIIESMREQVKTSCGAIKFIKERKIWQAELTEYNVNWAHTFGQAHRFEIDPSLTEYMDILIAAEQTPYKIELQAGAEVMSINNATNSLNTYVEEKLGGFSTDNLLTLVDNAPILGYTVDPVIEEVVIEAYGTRFWSLCSNRELKVDTMTSHNLVKDIATYAQATNRFPIFVYEPDMSDRLLNEFNRFFPGSMVRLSNQKSSTVEVGPDVKVIYTNKIPKQPFDRIPLMVSSAGMVFGGDRQMWIQNAEKVVYFTKEVYNKGVKGREVCKLD